jgi:hypothetical protein
MLGACPVHVQRCPRSESDIGRTGPELYSDVVCRGEKAKSLSSPERHAMRQKESILTPGTLPDPELG